MVRTRFAPSPTGYLHVGGLRTAAYAYALAKHSQGQFLLRIEDTDQKREIPGAREKIYELLQKFNLSWDGQPTIQSQRVQTGIYKSAAEKLVESGHAYREGGAIRLRIPKNETIIFHDFILNKDISWNSNEVPDAVLLKSDGFPTYHLAMPVDDADMGITHIIRTVEWLPSTPIHVLVFRYLDYKLPEIGHPTAILDPEGGKLSKRKGNVSVEEFLHSGYLPEAILNFIILLGWAPKDNRELYTLTEFVDHFDPTGFQKSNPVFNTTKLDWFNGYYIRQKSDQELVTLVEPFFPKANTQLLVKIIPLAKERVTTLKDFESLCHFFLTRPEPKNLNSDHLHLALEVLSSVSWSKAEIESTLPPQIKERGWKVGDFFMTLRLAIAGAKITPPLTESMLILGKGECITRLNNSLGIGH